MIVAVFSLSAFAKPPQLQVEKLFDGRFKGLEGVDMTIIKNKDSYYRGIKVENANVNVIKQIKDAFAIDEKNCEGSVYHDSKNKTSIILNFENNGEQISVVLTIMNGNLSMFISGHPDAFK